MTPASLALLLSEILFLATFLAAEPLELMADAGQIPVQTAYLYASRWRHGMAGSWPLYMPGFFAVAISAWFWALRRSIRQMLVEGCGLTLFALLVALLIQPAGASVVIDQFQLDTGLLCQGQPPANTAIGILRSVYTLGTFAAGIIAIQIAIARLQLRPLLLPVVMNLILTQIRPWTVTDFTGYWFRQVRDLNPVATLSFFGALLAAVTMFMAQFIVSKRGGDSFGSSSKTAGPVLKTDTSQ